MKARPASPYAWFDLEPLQLRVARRADELSSRDPFGKPGLNLHCWLLAERELLGPNFPDATEPSEQKSHGQTKPGEV
jgi:hypothetical protein